MQRSYELALDSLPQADRELLERERGQLREQLAGRPPPRRLPHIENRELEANVRAVESARERERLLRERREQLRWRDRSARADLDILLERHLDEQHEREARLQKTVATRCDRHDRPRLAGDPRTAGHAVPRRRRTR